MGAKRRWPQGFKAPEKIVYFQESAISGDSVEVIQSARLIKSLITRKLKCGEIFSREPLIIGEQT